MTISDTARQFISNSSTPSLVAQRDHLNLQIERLTAERTTIETELAARGFTQYQQGTR